MASWTTMIMSKSSNLSQPHHRRSFLTQGASLHLGACVFQGAAQGAVDGKPLKKGRSCPTWHCEWSSCGTTWERRKLPGGAQKSGARGPYGESLRKGRSRLGVGRRVVPLAPVFARKPMLGARSRSATLKIGVLENIGAGCIICCPNPNPEGPYRSKIRVLADPWYREVRPSPSPGRLFRSEIPGDTTVLNLVPSPPPAPDPPPPRSTFSRTSKR